MMQGLAATILLLGLLLQGPPRARSRVQVVPLFWSGQGSPAFSVECRNNSGVPRSKLDYVMKSSALRIDGTLHERHGFVGSLLGPSDIQAGGSFTQLVVLGTPPSDPIEVPGTWVMTGWDLALQPGLHAASFRCWTEWSAEVRFIWGRQYR
jgi:hypothetical protein